MEILEEFVLVLEVWKIQTHARCKYTCYTFTALLV